MSTYRDVSVKGSLFFLACSTLAQGSGTSLDSARQLLSRGLANQVPAELDPELIRYGSTRLKRGGE